MNVSRIYVDFQKTDEQNRLILACAGTIADLARYGIKLKEGLALNFYSDDANDEGEPDELRVEGVVHFNKDLKCWVAAIDWSAIRHASDEQREVPHLLELQRHDD